MRVGALGVVAGSVLGLGGVRAMASVTELRRVFRRSNDSYIAQILKGVLLHLLLQSNDLLDVLLLLS